PSLRTQLVAISRDGGLAYRSQRSGSTSRSQGDKEAAQDLLILGVCRGSGGALLPSKPAPYPPLNRMKLQHLARTDRDHLCNHPSSRCGSQLMTAGRVARLLPQETNLLRSLAVGLPRAPLITASVRSV